MEKLVAFDFETEAIEWGHIPPKPVGLAIQVQGKQPRYYAFAHPIGNNCTERKAREILKNFYDDPEVQLVAHNAKFDFGVAQKHFGLAVPPWDKWHDTMLLAFLDDPNSKELGLKALGAQLLDLAAREERDLQRYVYEHFSAAKRRPSSWGAFIGQCPGDLVAPYAEGDVERTLKLALKFREHFKTDYYKRERRLLPHLMKMEREGVPVDTEALRQDMKKAEQDLELIENWIRARLGAPNCDIDKREQLADAIEHADLLKKWYVPHKRRQPTERWLATTTGKRSTAIEDLREVVSDAELVDVIAFRAQLTTQMRTFGRPWLEQLQRFGRVHCTWNQVRQAGEKRQIGARTGRLSSTPNVQNVSARISRKPIPIPGVALIDLRARVAAPRGYQLALHDYNQQELRLLAHFEADLMCQAYNENPRLDLHGFARDLVNDILKSSLTRDQIKPVGFGIVYGIGGEKLGKQINESTERALEVRSAYKEAFPSLAALDRTLRYKSAKKQKIYTLGMRPFECEEPKKFLEESEFGVEYTLQTFEYKLINTLIQGSAADQTKEAMISYAENSRAEGQLILSVHDELVSLVPAKAARNDLKLLGDAMVGAFADELRVPVVVDGKIGRTWRECK